MAADRISNGLDPLLSGGIYTMTLVPRDAIGDSRKLYGPFSCCQADMYGFI
jgi:hypothetical protein